MLLHATIDVCHSELVLGPTLDRLPDADVHSPCRLDGPPSSPTFFHVSGVGRDRIETVMDADPTVTDRRCVVDREQGRTYRLRVTADAVPLTDPAAERGIQIHEARSLGEGWKLRLGAPDREALNDFRAYCRERDVSFDVERLWRTEHAVGSPVLSDRQREALLAALEVGYFDVPREATQGELADRLGVSGSAVSQRLRRAMRELVTSSLCPPTDER